ncbi:MAG: hypothetical protein WAN89_06360 [Lawsonella sp.]|nr:hypothetical protein [Mycobacteriales bacterium]
MGRLILILAVIAVLVMVYFAFRPQRKNDPDSSDYRNDNRPLGPDDDPDFLRKL